MSYWLVPKVWIGQTVVVMASGGSLTPEHASKVTHLPRIVTNATFKMAPGADIVYGSDIYFWRHYTEALDLPGLKVSIEQVPGVAPDLPRQVLYLKNDGQAGISHQPDRLKTGSNSGYAALQIAYLAGASRILLLGFDMRGTHWHGDHARPLTNPGDSQFSKWITAFSGIAPELSARRVEVINCSPTTALTCFRKSRLEDCL